MNKALVTMFVLVFLLGIAGLAKEIMVTSIADSGTGSLRQALQQAYSGDTITFDPKVFPPENPATIYPTSKLQLLYSGITIDASNAGVILDGSRLQAGWCVGLEVLSNDNTIQGLQVINFADVGIDLTGASHNVIGGDRSLGIGPLGQGNLVSGNGIGIDVSNWSSLNTISGNLIGTDVSGNRPFGNSQQGVWIEKGCQQNTVGPNNVIAYNCHGIEISGSRAVSNTITANRIYSNECTPICLVDGGNGEIEAPFLAEVDSKSGRVAGSACPSCTVEVFTQTEDGGSFFEGETQAAEDGWFILQKSSPLVGEVVTATVTNEQGSTSQLSRSTQLLQSGNVGLPSLLESRPSNALEDNHIGVHFINLWHLEPEVFPNDVLDPSHLLQLGVKSVRFSINDMDPHKVVWSKPEFSIDSAHDEFISSLADNSVEMTYVLSFWDTERAAQGWTTPSPRFKTESEIQRYLDFARFIVRHFKNRIDYYEIWNEPTIRDTAQWIEVEDYINLVKRAVPVIRQECPAAKIVVGGVSYLRFQSEREYLFDILQSDVMPLVDVVSWHPMYATSPEYDFHRQYYYEYPSIVREIKKVASSHGFSGGYVADELAWRTPDQVDITQDWPSAYSETQCAKYYARGIVMHLGMDVAMSQILLWRKPQWYQTIQNLCTTMAGHEAITIPVEIDIDYNPIAHYGFRFPNGDRILAIWTDGIAQDEDAGVPATIMFPGLTTESVTGIDVLHGFEQELIFEVEDASTVIHDLLVKDYPILLRLSGVTESEDYQELLQKKADRDGDGVPDEEDYCPDYPGDPAANGC